MEPNEMYKLPWRLRKRLTVTTEACWVWTGGKNMEGYGRIAINGKSTPVHRVAWEAMNGPIPAGLQIDHLCKVRLCCNPTHMEPVTPRTNTLRGAKTKLNSLQRGLIHSLKLEGYGSSRLAALLDVTKNTIKNYVSGRTYRRS